MPNDFNVLSSGDESGSPLGNKDTSDYVEQLLTGMWRYRTERFAGRDELFDRNKRTKVRPPVFRKEYADHNVIVEPDGASGVNAGVLGAVRPESRHRWFASMKSSQALTQSVFANLIARDRLDVLAGLQSDDGEVAFFEDAPAVDDARLEAEIATLGEPSRTSVDVLFEGGSRVAVECKLTEWETGSCSRPMMEDEDPRYCNGIYTFQQSNLDRCSLTTVGVRYWSYIPRLFVWRADQDLRPCPLRFTFQLVRNVLGACVRPDGQIAVQAHAALVYDARNPAFQKGGAGMDSWAQARGGLKESRRLRRVSWQAIIERMAQDSELGWLVAELRAKYGF